MATRNHEVEFSLEPADNVRLANLCGRLDENLRLIETRLGVEVANRGNRFRIVGPSAPTESAGRLLRALYEATAENPALGTSGIEQALARLEDPPAPGGEEEPVMLRTPTGVIRARNERQTGYIRQILAHDISFGIGPAGTGKTYLAVACAVDALERDAVSRILLVRPAVEAGERLGFLPGALEQKVDPYQRPLYDALYEMFGFERVGRLLEKNVIELAPLAYMRGRTLNEAFIILDEAQNTTVEQMKMFLTRIGFGARAVITGDITQVDLPRNQPSGLRHAMAVLEGVSGIGFTHFTARDVVRNPLVQRIVEAYAAAESKKE